MPLAAELPPPNILWICAEDISPAFGAYGDPIARTPHIDRLAQDSQVFRNAFASAPICAPARSCLITGLYATSMGTQHLRSEVPIPEMLKTLPELLRPAGYYTTNNVKTDYNFDAADRWDELSPTAHWKNTPPGKPFFSVFNYGLTHEGNGNKEGFDHDALLADRVDPAQIDLPPYFPNTPTMRALYARYYDLITVFDQKVGEQLKDLERAGLLENTVVFIFSDHGFGLPRYKRWLYRTGLQVPLVVHVPEAYRAAFAAAPGMRDDLVSFPDMAPTVLDLAGVAPTPAMHGQSFLAKDFERPFVYGARSRADDVYNIARAIVDQRYTYVRNYTPHRPYVEDAVIFAPESKGSFRELHRLRALGQLNPEAEAFWQTRPAEELYDTASDPHELHNLAQDPHYADTLAKMRGRLHSTLRETRDVGLLHESEYMRRAAQAQETVYEYAQSEAYNLEQILVAAETVGRPEIATANLLELLSDLDSGVRYWGVIALQQRPQAVAENLSALQALLEDPSPAVALAAAEVLIDAGESRGALPVIAHYLSLHEEPTTVLNAAMVARRIGDAARPLLPDIHREYDRYQGKVWGRYASWSYPMFIGMSFDQIRINCGETVDLERH